ncbi:hypothetical protein AABC73_13515 [Pseudomonas sp. G.S.17]|uniref:hypothetical protein n=1 Tax=Pseudomonas sp. G.S.17 TaxID=3137451 RepID=UPI00311CD510
MKDGSDESSQTKKQRRGRAKSLPVPSIRKGVVNRAFYVELSVPSSTAGEHPTTSSSGAGSHVLARIFADRIETWPTVINPGFFSEYTRQRKPYPHIVYRLPKPFAGPLPTDPSSAVSHIERVFDSGIFNSCALGLGFKPSFNAVLHAFQIDKSVDTIEIHYEGDLFRRENVVCVSEATLNDLRKAFNIGDAFWNRQKEGSRGSYIYEEIVEKLAPDLKHSDDRGGHYFSRFSEAERDYLATLQAYIRYLPLGMPEDFKAMRESMDRGELYRMIHHYQILLAQNLSAAEWQSFLSHNIDLVVKCLQHPECSVLEPPLGAQPKSAIGNPIIYGHEALVLTVRSPYATLMIRDSLGGIGGSDLEGSGEQPGKWIPHPELASAIEEGRKLRPDIKGQIQKPRCVVVAGLMPANVDEAAAYISYREAARKYKGIQLVDFGTLLNGFRLLASAKET